MRLAIPADPCAHLPAPSVLACHSSPAVKGSALIPVCKSMPVAVVSHAVVVAGAGWEGWAVKGAMEGSAGGWVVLDLRAHRGRCRFTACEGSGGQPNPGLMKGCHRPTMLCRPYIQTSKRGTTCSSSPFLPQCWRGARWHPPAFRRDCPGPLRSGTRAQRYPRRLTRTKHQAHSTSGHHVSVHGGGAPCQRACDR
jgi:hypothetical protein